ncbi:polysaccharide deacetylase family protein [Dethiobacter alkaliphilus]|uniref:Polysaccharide deacetylase n=1 Tax=Dethiobacter alkaliphilus AHT 1 TaxID=555088 RepID=C0GK70_DETAL|nr:polysaccharide deacetylase family protein [Dethiobacter alkaliphilus]EEG76253.1 polysaccharide deacetylase [Dethiobacter alkaliphilus AHT 1]
MKLPLKKWQIAVLVVLPVLFLSVYTLAFWQPWNQSEPPPTGTPPSEVVPPVEPDLPEPVPAPEPEPGPQPQPDPAPKPQPEPKPQPPSETDKPDTPIIYVDQQLLIPTSKNGSLTHSKVVREGTLSAGQKQIALTFDAGWLHEQTIPLLDVLDKYQVKSTFFPRALWVKDYPHLGREIVNRGHILENHSLTHGDMSKMTDQQIRQELRESTRILKETTNSKPYLFRPPYGAYNDRMLQILAQEGYPYTVMWTVDTHDWAREIRGEQVTVDYLVNRVLNNASDKGIILMHIGGYNTVEALPRIISGLREDGYKLVTVNEMLPPPEEGYLIHTVRQGETLYSISKKYGVSVAEVIDANDL